MTAMTKKGSQGQSVKQKGLRRRGSNRLRGAGEAPAIVFFVAEDTVDLEVDSGSGRTGRQRLGIMMEEDVYQPHPVNTVEELAEAWGPALPVEGWDTYGRTVPSNAWELECLLPEELCPPSSNDQISHNIRWWDPLDYAMVEYDNIHLPNTDFTADSMEVVPNSFFMAFSDHSSPR